MSESNNQSIVFCDGTNLVIKSKDGNEKVLTSDYITDYTNNAVKQNQSKAWKQDGYGARFRGESDVQTKVQSEKIEAFINSASLVDDDTLLYSFTINNMSGIYKKSVAKKEREEHVIHSNTMEFLSTEYNQTSDKILMSIKNDHITSHVGIFDFKTNDYTFLTSGDAKDENPSYSRSLPDTVFFSSKGVGRTSTGEFGGYSNASILKMNLVTKQIDEVLFCCDHSLLKPKDDENGNLYYIKRPKNERKNPFKIFLDILLIPFKLIWAIYSFLEMFVMMFTGKTFTSKDSNPVKGRNQNSRKIEIEGNLINVDAEFKRQRRKKDKDAGFIPLSWQLIKQDKRGQTTVLKNGICDYAILNDGTIFCTNGKAVFKIEPNQKPERLALASVSCFKLGVATQTLPTPDSIF